jgi:hypothetical protein
MRHSWLSVLYFCFAVSAGFAQTASSQTFPLPKSHVWEPKTAQICGSVGRVGIRQAKETPDSSEYFLVEAGRGDRRLEITLGEREVLVSVDGAKPEKYKVVATTVGVLTAQCNAGALYQSSSGAECRGDGQVSSYDARSVRRLCARSVTRRSGAHELTACVNFYLRALWPRSSDG